MHSRLYINLFPWLMWIPRSFSGAFRKLLKILYTNFGPHDERDMIVGDAQSREAATDGLTNLIFVPDDEIGYL